VLDLSKWVFRPAQLNNQPVAVKVLLGIPLWARFLAPWGSFRNLQVGQRIDAVTNVPHRCAE